MVDQPDEPGDDEAPDDDEAAPRPLDAQTVLAAATGASAVVLLIGYKLNRDVIYDGYWYLFAVVVIAICAGHFGFIDLSKLLSRPPRSDPEA